MRYERYYGNAIQGRWAYFEGDGLNTPSLANFSFIARSVFITLSHSSGVLPTGSMPMSRMHLYPYPKSKWTRKTAIFWGVALFRRESVAGLSRSALRREHPTVGRRSRQ